jgi:hypothetical protein
MQFYIAIGIAGIGHYSYRLKIVHVFFHTVYIA